MCHSLFLQLARKSLLYTRDLAALGENTTVRKRLAVRECLLQLVPDGLSDFVLDVQPLLEDRVTEDRPFHAVLLGLCRDFIFFSMIHGLQLFTNSRRQTFLDGY